MQRRIGPGPTSAMQRGRGRRLAFAACALAAHAGLLALMMLGLDRSAPPVPPTAITLTLAPRLRPPPALAERPEPSRPPALAARTPSAAAPDAATTPPLLVPPAAGPTVTGPAPTPGVRGEVRSALRASSGCDSAPYLDLSKAEMARCDARRFDARPGNTAVYAAVDPAKKDFFDGACKRDDDWCLYRTGHGPYPGLLALGRKKKAKGWD